MLNDNSFNNPFQYLVQSQDCYGKPDHHNIKDSSAKTVSATGLIHLLGNKNTKAVDLHSNKTLNKMLNINMDIN